MGRLDTVGHITPETELGRKISKIITIHKPKYIMETGTRIGLGSTLCILQALTRRKLPSTFHSIEVNEGYYNLAKQNLSSYFSNKYVNFEIFLGSSLPEIMMLTQYDVDILMLKAHELLKNIKVNGMHKKAVKNPGGRFDLIRTLVEANGYPDLILLDSEGHLGYPEFKLVMDIMKDRDFILILDDIYNIKHCYSIMEIVNNFKFNILAHGKERSGYCIAKYEGDVNGK